MLNPEIFKAYDIRGVYGVDFDDAAAYQIALAYVALRHQDGDCAPNQALRVAVGMDMRVSSPKLHQQVVSALVSSGVDVIDLGLVSTPAFYFAVANQNLDGGLIVSASHNPGEWNGFKIVRRKSVPVSGDSGLLWMRDWISSGQKLNLNGNEPGKIYESKSAAEEQLNHDLNYTAWQDIKPLKIVADSANGMGAQYLDLLAQKLPGEFIRLNFTFDGTFPAHEADPLKEENVKQLQEAILEHGADLGIATDGDGDRVFFVDNEGRTIEPAIIRGLLARSFLGDKPQAKIGYDVRPGKITEDLILENKGQPILTRVGHSLIKEQMLAEDIYFAGESSGHFFLNLPLGCFEMPNIMILRLLQEFSQAPHSISEYLKPLRKYYASGEINRSVVDKAAVINALSEKYAPGKLSFLDGITVTYPDYWFNVRGSNTENKMRLNLEAITPEIMAQKRDEILELMK